MNMPVSFSFLNTGLSLVYFPLYYLTMRKGMFSMSLIIGYVILIFPAISLISGFLCLIIKLLLKQFHVPFRKMKAISTFAFFVVLFTILFATLGSVLHSGIQFVSPSQWNYNLIPLSFLVTNISLSEIVWILKQFMLNTVMFIPFSFILPRLTSALDSLHRSLFVILIFGIIIEVFQLFIGRTADIDDIFAYLLGGCIGFLLNKGIAHRNSKRD